MSKTTAYIGIIFIWSTTPLSIQWSSDGVSIWFAVAARMLLGLITTWILLRCFKLSIPWHNLALKTYVLSGLGIYLSMACVYWSAQYIPSGWIPVVFGLSPIMTGIMAAVFLNEDALLPHKLVGMLLGFIGLCVVFSGGAAQADYKVYGLVGIFLSTLWHSMSAVFIKRLNADVPGLAITAGGLAIAVPLFLITWLFMDGNIPNTIQLKTLSAILYLGIIASAIGFAMYYYILNVMEVSRVALITLITPVLGLGLGNQFNNEALDISIIIGAFCIIVGLVFYQFGASIKVFNK